MFVSSSRRRRRRWPFVLGALALIAVAGGVVYLALGRAPGDISNPNVEFTGTDGDAAGGAAAEREEAEDFVWPTYGYDPQRTRYLDADVNPPLRRVWTLGGSKLLEFQPVLAEGRLFFVKNNGELYAVDADTGDVEWRRRVGTLAASSPAWDDGRLYVTTLSKRVLSLDADDGRIRWAKDLPSRSESSPLVLRGRVYFGSEDGTVYALRARDGREIWTYKASGVVTAALAYSRGVLYFGDYDDRMYAIRARNGSEVWTAEGQGRSFGRRGAFYATPAVAYGRVYVGNLDGKVYSFSARDGTIAWTHSTGGYVYAAPAVAAAAGTPPSVYIGSYDGTFYALDARTGETRWTHDAGGRISGAGTVVGRTVYFSNLGAKSTSGLDVRNGRRVFAIGRGAFNPVISDGERIYLTGYSSLYAFEPRRRTAGRREANRERRESRTSADASRDG